MSNPKHNYPPLKHNYPPLKHNDDDDSDGSIVMRTGANKAATKKMERAVFAGKKAIWPLFFATLLVGVGTSVWGLLKETGDREFGSRLQGPLPSRCTAHRSAPPPSPAQCTASSLSF